jgi:hypothetical protein
MLRRSIVLSAAVAVGLASSLSTRAQLGSDEPPWRAFIAAASADSKQAQASSQTLLLAGGTATPR